MTFQNDMKTISAAILKFLNALAAGSLKNITASKRLI